MHDLHVLSAELGGSRAPRAWQLLEQGGKQLARMNPRSHPRAFVDATTGLDGWLIRSVDPDGDAILHAALSIAVEHGWSAQADLARIVGARAANRGDLGAVAGWIRRAESVGPPTPSLTLLATHLGIRAGRPEAIQALDGFGSAAPGIRLQRALAHIAADRILEARTLLTDLRNGVEHQPLLRGAASFFLAEASLRRDLWEDVLTFSSDAVAAMAFMGEGPHRWTLQVWRARALRHLDQHNRARTLVSRIYDEARRYGVSEVMLEASIELCALTRGGERRRWQRELRALLPGSIRHEVHQRAALLLTDDQECPEGLRVHAGGRWFEADGLLHDIAPRPALRRILRALASHQGGPALDVAALFEAGWPGERIRLQSRHARVHTAIWQLRRLGLGNALTRHEDGYRLALSVDIVG